MEMPWRTGKFALVAAARDPWEFANCGSIRFNEIVWVDISSW